MTDPLTELRAIGEERERLNARLAELRDYTVPAVRRARDGGQTIAAVSDALGVSPQALYKLLGTIPSRTNNG